MTATLTSIWSRLFRRTRRARPTVRRLPIRMESLEVRDVPATLYGLTEANTLLRFDSAAPNTAFQINLTGLGVGETLRGIDYRPADEKLYGFSSDSSKVYIINTTTGAVTLVGDPGVNPLSTSFGFDFNPAADRIRVTGNDGANIRLNPINGSLVAFDTPLNGGSTNMTGVAYTNNFAGTTSTTLYGIDASTDKLYIFNGATPNDGKNAEVGLLGFDTDERVGFDIAYDDGKAYATLTVGGVSNLYTIDLVTGTATLVGKVGMGTPLIGVTAAPLTNNPPVVLFTAGTGKYDVQTDVAVAIDTGATITDPDSLNFDTGSLTVTLTGGNAADVLGILNQGTGPGQVGVSGSNVTFGGVTIGTFTAGGFGVPLVVSFNSNATVAAAQAVLRAVSFSTTDNVDFTTRTFSAKVIDGDGATMDTGVTPTDAKVTVGDFTAPVVSSITLLDPNPTKATALNFQVVFSEDVTGVDLTDFKVAGTFANPTTVFSITPVDAKTYNVLVNIDVTGEGTVRLDVSDDDTITDAVGNKLGGTGTGNGDFTTGEAYTIDRTGPIVILTQAPGQTDPAFGQPVIFFVSFSEDVTGFTESDIMLSGTAGATTVKIVPLAPGSNNYNVEVSGATMDGTVIINFGAGVAFDAAGNGNQDIDPFLFDNQVKLLGVINDAPVVTAVDVKTTEETSFTFTGTDAITVADSDLNGNEIQITLTATNGTLALTTTTGLTLIDNDGSDGTLSFKGLLADVNAALDGLTYTPALDFDGVATLKVDADDLGSTGAGGPQVGTTTVNITVDGVNDAPTITINTGGGLVTDEDTALSVPAGTVVIGDVDAGTNEVKVTLTGVNATLTLGSIVGLTFLTGDGTDDATMTFTGTLTDVNAALDTLSVIPALDFIGTASVLVDVDDQGNTGTGGPLTAADSFDVTVNDVNDAPVITAPATVTATEDTKFSFTGADSISIADVDLGAGEIEVTIVATNGTITFGDLTGLTFSVGDGTDDDTVTFKGLLADVNAALLTLSYTPAADVNGPATVTITADDLGNTGTGGAKQATQPIDVTIDAVNDAPVVTVDTSKGAQNTDEDTVFTFPAGTIVISDVDAGTDLVEVTISTDKGTLTLTSLTGLTFSLGDGTDDVTMTFQGTLTDINAALDGLKVNPPADFAGQALINIAVDDLGHNGSGGPLNDTGVATVTFDAVNDAPVNTVPAAQVIDEDKTLTLSGANAIQVADVDVGTGLMKITLTATNGTITLDGITGLTFTTGDGTADASMTFTGKLADVNAALDGMKFTPNANFSGAAEIKIVSDDQGNTGTGGALTDTDTVAVTVTAANDAPIAVGDTFSTKQNQVLSIPAPGLLANDSDPEGTPLSVVIVTDVPAAAGKLVSVGNGAFTFTPAPNFVGTTSFTYKASDGLLTSNTVTVTINVTGSFTRLFATGADAGGDPHVEVYNEDGSLRFSFYAYEVGFNGGVNVSTGDVNGDGVEDIITGAGPGGMAHVRVFSGVDLGQIHSFDAFPGFGGGVNVTAGDVDGDGLADIIVGAGFGGGPHVKVMNGKTGGVIQEFFAYSPSFLGGVNVAAGDFTGDNKADIVTGAGPGGAPHVMVYAGMTSRVLSSFLAFDKDFGGGVRVATGKFNNETAVFCAAGSGGVPVVTVMNAKTGTQLASFFAFEQEFSGGVHIGSEVQLDGTTVLFLGKGSGDLPTVRVIEANTLQDTNNFNAYDPAFLGGVFVG